MLVSKYLNQKVELIRTPLNVAIGKPVLDAYGDMPSAISTPEGASAIPVIIKCRKELKTVDVQQPNGTVAKSTALYVLDTPVTANDFLDGESILAIADKVDLSGTVQGYEVLV